MGSNVYVQEAFFNKYCLNTSITQEDVVNYFNTLNNGDSITFKMYIIGIKENKVDVITRQYRLYNDGHFILEYTVNDEESHEKVEDIILSIQNNFNIYCLLFDSVTTAEIVKSRLSCLRVDPNYASQYTKHIIRNFVNYFSEYPFIVAHYFKIIYDKFPNEYFRLIQSFHNTLADSGSYKFLYQTDPNTYAKLQTYYNEIIN